MACGRFVGTSELSNQGDALVHELGASGDTCYITEDGRAKAVLLDINRYNALMDLIEDSELPTNEIRSEFKEQVSVRGILRDSHPRVIRKQAR
jgi:PHD/YefM family antitoxin component YafN of YafNO toxin-antitoxin module